MTQREHEFAKGGKECWCGKYHYYCDRCGVDCTLGRSAGPAHSMPHPKKEYRLENFVTLCHLCYQTSLSIGLEAILAQIGDPAYLTGDVMVVCEVDPHTGDPVCEPSNVTRPPNHGSEWRAIWDMLSSDSKLGRVRTWKKIGDPGEVVTDYYMERKR